MYNELSEIKQITNADTLRQMLAQCEDEIMRLEPFKQPPIQDESVKKT